MVLGRSAALMVAAQVMIGFSPAAWSQTAPTHVFKPETDVVFRVKPVTDEHVFRPPRRPADAPYLCSATFRVGAAGGAPQVVLFTGEREAKSFHYAPDVRADLSCSLAKDGRSAEVSLLVVTPTRDLLAVKTTVVLPAAPR
jgi:hypothetical protein